MHRNIGMLLLVCIGNSALAAEEAQKTTTVEGVSEYLLPNGARVLLFPELSRPSITVNMTVLVGSRHEGYGEAGMAHLLEHLVFKGTPTFPNWSTVSSIVTTCCQNLPSFVMNSNAERTVHRVCCRSESLQLHTNGTTTARRRACRVFEAHPARQPHRHPRWRF